MSLYHETASILDADLSGGNLRSRVFAKKDLKSSPVQVYALALETCKWSPVLCEVIDQSQLLSREKKVCNPSSAWYPKLTVQAYPPSLSPSGP